MEIKARRQAKQDEYIWGVSNTGEEQVEGSQEKSPVETKCEDKGRDSCCAGCCACCASRETHGRGKDQRLNFCRFALVDVHI
mmetsp:Transcript_27899/g.60729  ORF Transcript_27899/g.60729 Transcript_27899/m.60729 type:complete len:82 (+) Transcript_27899:1441-1686(+)